MYDFTSHGASYAQQNIQFAREHINVRPIGFGQAMSASHGHLVLGGGRHFCETLGKEGTSPPPRTNFFKNQNLPKKTKIPFFSARAFGARWHLQFAWLHDPVCPSPPHPCPIPTPEPKALWGSATNKPCNLMHLTATSWNRLETKIPGKCSIMEI